MRDKIVQLAKGEFTYQQPEIILSVEEINLEIELGKSICSAFSISGKQNERIAGRLYTTSELITLKQTYFDGATFEVEFEMILFFYRKIIADCIFI